MPSAFRHLVLERPLAVIDAETTGLDSLRDRIVEVAALVLAPGTGPVRYRRLVDPGVPIPEAASAVHGITNAMVVGEDTFGEISPRLFGLLEGADLAGFNLIRYDLPLLVAEFRRAGVAFAVAGRAVVDVQRIYHRFEPRNLAAVVRFYCGREHDGAHSALPDVEAAAAVLDAQVERYADLPSDVESLHEKLTDVDVGGRFRTEDGRAVFTFGKHKGRRLDEVARQDPGYLEWFLREDFLDDAKSVVDRALRQAESGA